MKTYTQTQSATGERKSTSTFITGTGLVVDNSQMKRKPKMFTLKLQDRNGQELKQGDIVKVSDGKRYTFYTEVKFFKETGIISPFDTFSFHSFEKVDKVPDGLIERSGDIANFRYWVAKDETDIDGQQFNGYLMSWRTCENLIKSKCFLITEN